MEDVTTLADLMYVMAKRRISDCRIFTTYDGGLTPFAAARLKPYGDGDLLLEFEAVEESGRDGPLASIDDFFALAEDRQLDHRRCRLFATIDGGETVLAACVASAFNGGDIHLSFMPATTAGVFAAFAGDAFPASRQPGLSFAL